MTELRVAVPRGALFADTLALLDRLGLDTTEVRAGDRRLLFEESGIVTMRPSDVPTYVEAGAAATPRRVPQGQSGIDEDPRRAGVDPDGVSSAAAGEDAQAH